MFSALPGYEGQGTSGAIPLDPLWSNVSLALHGDGTNGATTVVDDSTFAHTSPSSGRGTSALSTTQKKFGSASIKFNADGGLIYQTGSAATEFAFGTGDFMIRCWLWVATAGAATTRAIYDSRRNGGSANGFVVFLDSTNKLRIFRDTSYPTIDTVSFPLDQWVHFAMWRRSGLLSVTKHGVLLTNALSGEGFDYSDGRCCVGEVNPEYQATTSMNGYIDDFELVKGEAVYTGAFTPPTAPFPNS